MIKQDPDDIITKVKENKKTKEIIETDEQISRIELIKTMATEGRSSSDL
jgi:hypothetical protein